MNACFHRVLFLTESTCAAFFADALQYETRSHVVDKHKLLLLDVVPVAASSFNRETWS